MDCDILIRNAKLRSGAIADIAVSNGQIQQMGSGIRGSGKLEIDAKRKLTTETFVIAHLHLDKVMTGPLVTEEVFRQYQHGGQGGTMTAIELASQVKEKYKESEIIDRVRKVLTEAKFHGVSHIRAFADVDTKAKLIGIQALVKIREEFKGLVDVEVVAFPQDGIRREPGAEEYMWKAMELGADVVGGIPWIEYTDEDMKHHIDFAYELAKKFNKDIAMLTDDGGDPELRTTEYLAVKAIKEGWTSRIAACHARATALYNEIYHRKFIAILKRAGMGIVTDPHTGPFHVRVQDLLNAGINVALGQDDVNDAYYPYGRCNMLEVAFLASHLLWMFTSQDRETIYDMITVNPAKIMHVGKYGLAAGNEANIVIHDANDLLEAYTYHPEASHVIRKGKLVAQSSTQRKTP
ncbi:MAG: amidohydrolase family protein [Candidatus Bathyarchaeia archaeon]